MFFTNHLSRKGRALAANPDAALLFFWPDLERQVRIEGVAAPLEPAESAAYFAGRPRSSQLGAWASPQSEPIAGRAALEARFAEAEARYCGCRAGRCPVRRTGAATASSPTRSSSGRAAPRASTIAFAIDATRSTPARGSSTGWRRERRRRPDPRTLAALIPLGIANHAVLTGSRVIVSLDALSMGASPFTVGVLVALYALLPMFLSVAAGRLVDRIGARRPMLVGSVAIGIAATLPVAFPGFPSLFVGATLLGIGFMAFQLAAQNTTGEIGGPAARARNFSLLALGYSVSSFVGPLLAGFAIDHFGFRAAFGDLRADSARSRSSSSRAGGSRLPGPHAAARCRAPRRRRWRCCGTARCAACSRPTRCCRSAGTCTRSSFRSTAPRSGCRRRRSAACCRRSRRRRSSSASSCRRSRAGCREHQVLAAALLLARRGVLRVPVPAERAGAVRAFVHARAGPRRRAAGGAVAVAHARAAGRMGEAAGVRMALVNSMSCRGAARARRDRRVRRDRARCSGRSARAWRRRGSLARRGQGADASSAR